jgi:hypothetical protein
LIFDLRDLLGFLAFFALLGFSSHLCPHLLHDCLILLILLRQFLHQFLVHLLCQVGSDLLVVLFDVGLVLLFVFLLDLSFFLFEHLLVFVFHLLLGLLLECRIFLSELRLESFLLILELLLLLTADLSE